MSVNIPVSDKSKAPAAPVCSLKTSLSIWEFRIPPMRISLTVWSVLMTLFPGLLSLIVLHSSWKLPLLRFALYIPLVFAVGCFMLHRLPGITDFRRFLFPLWNAGIVITFFYNGRKGRFPVFSKYFFYVWYPLHLLLQRQPALP